jgi:hypothetical protein
MSELKKPQCFFGYSGASFGRLGDTTLWSYGDNGKCLKCERRADCMKSLEAYREEKRIQDELEKQTPVMFCPHCGASSNDHTIRCNTQYDAFSILTCYACGKTHIRDVQEKDLELLVLKARELQNLEDLAYVRIAQGIYSLSFRSMLKYVQEPDTVSKSIAGVMTASEMSLRQLRDLAKERMKMDDLKRDDKK